MIGCRRGLAQAAFMGVSQILTFFQGLGSIRGSRILYHTQTLLWLYCSTSDLTTSVDREAARECRRKKKEYIKCLENRVAVLENQNKALIDELKSLKELYCQQKTE
ncbi:Cyclic AMP-responsive element-binding protein 1 [Homalodisca vitripennis]|nr:Cyclic AMP-responsive element-binding protein 1 [Homalodisca vitripennis]